jgi:hypothetical protein
VGTILQFIYIKFYPQANNRSKYADRFYNSIIDDKNGHIYSPINMFTCTAFLRALLQWQKNQGVHPQASKSMLTADRPDRLNYFNYKNVSSTIASCCTATGHRLITLPGFADTHMFSMNTWNTLPVNCQQRVYKNTLAAVKHQIQQAENPTPAIVISVEAAHIDNAILLDYLTSKVALEEPEIRSTNSNIPITNNSMDDKLHFWMPWDSRNYKDEGDECDKCNAIPTTSQQ